MVKLGSGSQSPLPALPWQDCAAKTTPDGARGRSVVSHCVDVGRVAAHLLGVLPPAVLKRLGTSPATSAALHDVGKVSPGYQLKHFSAYIRGRVPELAAHALENFETRHALIGEAAVNEYLQREETPSGIAVGAHHGSREQPRCRNDAGIFGGPNWAAQRLALIGHLCRELGPLNDDAGADPYLLAGLVSVADWIGSDERFFDPSDETDDVCTAARAAEAVESSGWVTVNLRPGLTFEQVFGVAPYPLQRTFAECVRGPGLYVLEAPMGAGKTEAALYAAYRLVSRGTNSGLYFGLPTRLTSDKIHERVRNFLTQVAGDDAGLRLAHGNAWMRAFQPGGGELAPGKEWFRPSKRALLMPFAVGTIDQALLAVIKVRHFFVRCLGLAGKVVVLDEVHSYDVYTGMLLDVLVQRLLAMGCTVIVLSATLTGARRGALLADAAQLEDETAYPLITAQAGQVAQAIHVEAPGSSVVEIHVEDLADHLVAERATTRAAGGECVICIANTVAKAQAWYNHVKATMREGAFEVGLLHSRFPAWRREELETRWTAALGKGGPRPRGCVLVATQVVEQSVDLDADFMITELAPTDMLLQRLGRLWRHPRPERPSSRPSLLVVSRNLDEVDSLQELAAALGNSNARVYAPYVLWQTFQAWKGLSALRLPDDIRGVLERTYGDPPGALKQFVSLARGALHRRAAKLRDLAVAARADVMGFPTMADREGVATRYSDYLMLEPLLARSVHSTGDAATIVLSNGDLVDVGALRWVPPVAIALHRSLVPVPQYRLRGISTPRFLQRYFHEVTPVLLIGDAGELTSEARATGLSYDDEHGLQTSGAVPAWASRSLGRRDLEYDEDGGFDESDW